MASTDTETPRVFNCSSYCLGMDLGHVVSSTEGQEKGPSPSAFTQNENRMVSVMDGWVWTAMVVSSK